MAFLIVATTAPEDIAAYANRVGNAWKIGRRGVGDGVLLVIARDEPPFVVEPSLPVTRVAKTAMVERLSGGKVDVSAGTYRFLHDNYL